MLNNRAKLLIHSENRKSIELMKLVFNEQNMKKLNDLSEDYWNWQNSHHPLGPAKIWVIEDGGQKVIAQYVDIPVKLSVGGKQVKGGMTIDLLVHPDYRRQGFFKTLGNAAIDDLGKIGWDFQIAFPKRQYVHDGFMNRLNWIKIGNLPLLIKPIDLINIFEKKFGNSYVIKAIAWNMKIFGRCFSKIIFKQKENKFTFKLLTKLPEEINDLSKGFINQFPISIVRDKSYLEWRYLQKPNGNYKILGIFSDNELLGIVVLKVKKIFSLEVGFIVDILSILDKEVIDSLIKEALNLFSKEKINFCVCIFTKNNIYYKFLRKNGFFSIPAKINSMKYILDAYMSSPRIDKKLFTDIDNWFITMGDWDII